MKLTVTGVPVCAWITVFSVRLTKKVLLAFVSSKGKYSFPITSIKLQPVSAKRLPAFSRTAIISWGVAMSNSGIEVIRSNLSYTYLVGLNNLS